jgi:hypothetical protein
MTINEIKDEIVKGITEFATTEAKEAVMGWLKDKVVPAAKEVAAVYTGKLKEAAATESGWNKFRDSIFLPTLIDGAIWLTDKALGKMVPQVVAAPTEPTPAANETAVQ